jgi:hypothetical protein
MNWLRKLFEKKPDLWDLEPRPWPRVYGHRWPDTHTATDETGFRSDLPPVRCTCTSCSAKWAYLDGNGSAFPPEGIYYDKPNSSFERARRSSFDRRARADFSKQR